MSRKFIAVIPAAGLGTRFLPVSRVVPKELMPIGGKPALHWVLEELAQAKVFDVAIVISPGKKLLKDYCTASDITYDHQLKNPSLLKDLKAFMGQFNFHWVMQDKPDGLGHAVHCAKSVANGAWPIVVLPDMIIDHTPNCVEQLLTVTSLTGRPVIATHRVPHDQVSQYGVLDVQPSTIKNLYTLTHVVEKPKPDSTSSSLVITGRYLLPPSIFDYLEGTLKGQSDEIQLTDAINAALAHEGMDALEYEGTTLDTGEPKGWLAANLHFSKK